MAQKMRLFASVEEVYEALKDGAKLNDEYHFTHPEKTKGRSIKLSLGRIWFNLLLPSDIEIINEPVDAKLLGKIVRRVVSEKSPEDAADFITKINQESYHIGMYCPTTFEIDSLILSPKIKKEKEDLQKNGSDIPAEFQKETKKVYDDLLNDAEEKDYRLYNIPNSKAKNAPLDGLLIAKGSVADIEGNVSKPIRSALTDGATIEEYYQCAAEARRGHYYKSAISAKPGYLARRVCMANANVVLDISVKDCKTNHYHEILVTPEIAGIIKNRYQQVNGRPKLIEDPTELIGKTIKLRSPLYCKSEKGICPICYGDSWKDLDTKNIGILAGGDINKIALDLYMKTRHQSSVTEYVDINFERDLSDANLLTDVVDKNLTVEKNKITAKNNCYIVLNKDDYNDATLIESIDYYLIPGILTININDSEDKINTPFTYQVKLYKPTTVDDNKDTIVLSYTPGEVIMEQTTKEKTLNVAVLEQLLEGQLSYITRPETLVMYLHGFMPNVELNVLETIVQNMFRDSSDLSTPARLTDYTDFQIVGQRRIPILTNWANAMVFEHVDKAIKAGLLSNKNVQEDPLLKIVDENYSTNKE